MLRIPPHGSPDLLAFPDSAGTTFRPAALLLALFGLFATSPASYGIDPMARPEATNWWSLRPLTRPAIPREAGPGTHPVDAFVVARLRAAGLQPAPAADRRTLVRRLSYDLVGLPPTPEEIEAFVRDPRPDAYERLVDRLLASPRHGERWARHWLDVAHYGDTHGYDKDQPRPNAWPYRDYVVRAFNADKAYGRFVAEQVAGDVLFPGARDGLEATGFLAAGPWDLIGHAEVPETKTDGKVARHLDRDDMVANTLQSFCSLTVQCAQCHDHKSDPISQDDYYGLQAVFAAVDRADREYDVDPDVGHLRAAARTRLASATNRIAALEGVIRSRAGEPLASLERALSAARNSPAVPEAHGYHSAIAPRADVPKWVQVDLGRVVSLAAVVLRASEDDFNGIGAGFGFPLRYRVESSTDGVFPGTVLQAADFTSSDVPNPRRTPVRIDLAGVAARFVRITAVRLAPRKDDFIFALAELEAFDTAGANVALHRPASALDSVEAAPRWGASNLTDGLYPAEAQDLGRLESERRALLAAHTLPADDVALAAARGDAEAARRALAALPAPSTAYVAAVYRGSGAFAGTGADGGRPRPIRVLSRGDVRKPLRDAVPGALGCAGGMSGGFDLPPGHAEGERRAALARWLSHPDNPLTWRSIVNRVWQHHFGRGLVDTPNDFGRMGSRPTHPELLDWLAVEFRDGGQSLKALHRTIVTSATYRRASSAADPDGERIDADNRLLRRQNRRKLEAEALRDAVLLVSGGLDSRMGGPGFRDFAMERPEHSPHYQYHLADPDAADSRRRSVYRFVVRSQPQPFMAALDCADPSMQVGRRNESASPLQALTLLNNPFMLAMSARLAARLEAGGGPVEARLARAHLEALGRAPAADELSALAGHAREHGMANTCRLLFNLNEFAFVD